MTKGDGGEEALVKKTGHLWIKSLKVFDIENREKKDILLEHVDGDLDRFRLYDSSFIQFEEWIFYYKRIRPADKPSQLKLFKYNLLTFQEEVMADSFAIEEPTGIQFNVIFGERFGVKSN